MSKTNKILCPVCSNGHAEEFTFPVGKGKFVLVDSVGAKLFTSRTWRLQGSVDNEYLTHLKKVGSKVFATLFHREIMGLSFNDGKFVDHINGKTLDNRLCNLRLASHAENMRNSKPRNKRKFKGTVLLPSGRYIATIKPNGKQMSLGTYDTEQEAAYAYDKASYKYFGRFGWLNFPENVRRYGKPGKDPYIVRSKKFDVKKIGEEK